MGKKEVRPLVVAMLAFVIVGSPLYGADNDTTKGRLNGRFWTMMSATSSSEQKGAMVVKWIFLSGVKDALEEKAPQELGSYIPESLTDKETADALDVFYKVPENLPVPIIWALSVVSLRAKGGSAVEVEALTARWRKRAVAE